ncbi:hypothetical protein OQA88_8761 [Cercophora sp. LCS_1]
MSREPPSNSPKLVNITIDAVPDLLQHLRSENEQRLYMNQQYRVRLINSWRPLLPEYEDCPLALCDYASVDADDLVAADSVYPKRTQEVYYLKHNPRRRWFWLPKQRPDEPFLFMTYDSKPDNVTVRTHR